MKLLQKNLQSVDAMGATEAKWVEDIWALSIEDRWRLYRHWIHSYQKELRKTVLGIILKYQAGNEWLQEVSNVFSLGRAVNSHIGSYIVLKNKTLPKSYFRH